MALSVGAPPEGVGTIQSASPTGWEELGEDRLLTPAGIFALGAAVAQALRRSKQIAVFLNAGGVVELCPVQEIGADILEEPQAVAFLSSLGYTDDVLMNYLRARDTRLSRYAQAGQKKDDRPLGGK